MNDDRNRIIRRGLRGRAIGRNNGITLIELGFVVAIIAIIVVAVLAIYNTVKTLSGGDRSHSGCRRDSPSGGTVVGRRSACSTRNWGRMKRQAKALYPKLRQLELNFILFCLGTWVNWPKIPTAATLSDGK